jgi:hypothetical protein
MSSPGIVPQNVLLISENKLKNFSDIDPNVTSSVILPFISVCQQTKLEFIIGARYYKSLLNQVANNTIQNNETDFNFLTYFAQPMLIWAAYSECLPSVFMRIKNNGIVTGSEQTVTIKDMQYMQQRADDRSQFFEQRMIQEIIFNSNLYPLCFGYTTRDGLVPHLGKNYFSGVHLTNGQWTNSPGYMMKTYGLQSYSDPTYNCCGL